MFDLSVTVSAELPSTWPTHMPFSSKIWNYFTELHEVQGYIPSESAYQTRYWIIDEHCGTHFDAPPHFIPPADTGLPYSSELGAQSADKVPLDELNGLAAVIDVTHCCTNENKGISPWITVEDIQAWETRNGSLQAGEIVLFYTGWDKYYVQGAEGKKYSSLPVLQGKGDGWPAPHADTILYLFDKGIKCLGIDAPSVGGAHDGAPSHLAGLSRGMRYIEMLTGLGSLPTRGAYFMFLPVKVAGSTGGLGRAIALLEND